MERFQQQLCLSHLRALSDASVCLLSCVDPNTSLQLSACALRAPAHLKSPLVSAPSSATPPRRRFNKQQHRQTGGAAGDGLIKKTEAGRTFQNKRRTQNGVCVWRFFFLNKCLMFQARIQIWQLLSKDAINCQREQ